MITKVSFLFFLFKQPTFINNINPRLFHLYLALNKKIKNEKTESNKKKICPEPVKTNEKPISKPESPKRVATITKEPTINLKTNDKPLPKIVSPKRVAATMAKESTINLKTNDKPLPKIESPKRVTTIKDSTIKVSITNEASKMLSNKPLLETKKNDKIDLS